MGGEKLRFVGIVSALQGSPPRGRGKEPIAGQVGVVVGITPAWAGKSFPKVLVCLADWDHPRVGGEKPDVAAHVRAKLGSPPRGRGKGPRAGRQ